MEKKELKTFEEFRRARLDGNGFIVITDNVRPAIVHKLNSRCITPERFMAKVTLDKNAKGGYYLVDSVRSAAVDFGASGCKICKPHLPEKAPLRT